jgi:hypothetical protein
MTKFIYPAENLQGKWNKTTDSDNSKGWKSERYIRYPTKDSIETLLGIPTCHLSLGKQQN